MRPSGRLFPCLWNRMGGEARSTCRSSTSNLGQLSYGKKRVKNALHSSLVVGISVLWRKIVCHFKSYPWALAPAFDESRKEDERRATVNAFLKAPLCCLDCGLSRQLRQAFPPDPDIYIQDMPLSVFLATLFTRLVMTSTQVELQFSRMTGITNTRRKRLGLPGLAAKCMNVAFSAWVERWRTQKRGGKERRGMLRARPTWVRSKENGSRSFDLYKKDVHAKMLAEGRLDDSP